MTRSLALSFRGKSYANLQEVYMHIISLDALIQIKAMQQFNKQLLRFSTTSKDMILAQEELANDAAALRFEDNKIAMLLQANNASLTKKADNIRKA